MDRRLLAFAAMVATGCNSGSNLSDEQAAARGSQGVEDVCMARAESDDVVLIDRIFAGSAGPNSSSSSRRNNSWFLRLVVYDGATGQRKQRVTIDKIRIGKQASQNERASCLGWTDAGLWMWSRRHGLHIRNESGSIARSEAEILSSNAAFASGIAKVGFVHSRARVMVGTKDGRRWSIGDGHEAQRLAKGAKVMERRRSNGPTLRVQSNVHRGGLRATLRGGKRLGAKRDGGRIRLSLGGKPIGSGLDFKHVIELLPHRPSGTYEWDGRSLVVVEPGLDRTAPRTIRRLAFDGQIRWTIREPEPCAARVSCSHAAWQTTKDARRLYFYGRKYIHAFDATSGAVVWRAPY